MSHVTINLVKEISDTGIPFYHVEVDGEQVSTTRTIILKDVMKSFDDILDNVKQPKRTVLISEIVYVD